MPRAQRTDVLARADAAAEPWLRPWSLRRLIGADVHEYLPAAGWTKGDAVRWIAHDVERRTGQPPWVAYFGDDLTDEDAFRAADLSVVVGRRASGARYRLEAPADVAMALADLAVSTVDGGSLVTGAALSVNVAQRLGDTRLVVVANREPYIHMKDVHTPGLVGRLVGRKPRTNVHWMQPASGLVTALDPVMRACGGTWVAHGSGSAIARPPTRAAGWRCRRTIRRTPCGGSG